MQTGPFSLLALLSSFLLMPQELYFQLSVANKIIIYCTLNRREGCFWRKNHRNWSKLVIMMNTDLSSKTLSFQQQIKQELGFSHGSKASQLKALPILLRCYNESKTSFETRMHPCLILSILHIKNFDLRQGEGPYLQKCSAFKCRLQPLIANIYIYIC